MVGLRVILDILMFVGGVGSEGRGRGGGGGGEDGDGEGGGDEFSELFLEAEGTDSAGGSVVVLERVVQALHGAAFVAHVFYDCFHHHFLIDGENQ